MTHARVMIATPTVDSQVCTQFVQSIMAATVYCLYHKVEIELRIADRYSLVQYARNRLAQDFLDDESFTHILWIDSDIGFDPRAIVKLLAADKDIIGGAYPVKAFPSWFPVETETEAPEASGLFRAKTLPTGFLLVSRAAMHAVAETGPVYTHHHAGQKIPTRHIFDLALVDGEDGTKDLIGEDVVLCHRLRELGYTLWLDPDIDFQHVGMHRWGGNMAKNLQRHAAEIAAPKVPKSIALKLRNGDRSAKLFEKIHARWGSAWSLPASGLRHIASLAREATVILECGSGISTLVMALSNPNAEIHALEDDAEWAQRIEAELAHHNITNVHLHRCGFEDNWYALGDLELPAFDLVIADGPAFRAGPGGEPLTGVRDGLYTVLADQIRDAVILVDDVQHYGYLLEGFRHQVFGGRYALRYPSAAQAVMA